MGGSVCLDTSVSEYCPRYCHLSWGVDSYYLLLLCERRINGAWSTANQLLLWCVRFCSFIIHFMCGYGLTITATDFDTDGFVALLGRRCVLFSDLFCRSDQNVWSLKNWKLCCGIIAVNHISSIILKSTGRNIFRLPVAKYTRFSPNWQFCSFLNQWLCPSATGRFCWGIWNMCLMKHLYIINELENDLGIYSAWIVGRGRCWKSHCAAPYGRPTARRHAVSHCEN